MFWHLGSVVIPKWSAGLKQSLRAVVLICSQAASSWAIDPLLACLLHLPVAWHKSHHSHFEPLPCYINAEYRDKQAEAQNALVTLRQRNKHWTKGRRCIFYFFLEHWHSWSWPNTSANKESIGMPIQWLSKMCWASPPRRWRRTIY